MNGFFETAPHPPKQLCVCTHLLYTIHKVCEYVHNRSTVPVLNCKKTVSGFGEKYTHDSTRFNKLTVIS